MAFRRSAPLAILAVLVLYIGSYALLSWNGKFVPGCVGSGGVKWYEWMPAGFMRDQGLTVLPYVYYPLYWLDTRYVHSPEKAYRSTYPRQDYWD